MRLTGSSSAASSAKPMASMNMIVASRYAFGCTAFRSIIASTMKRGARFITSSLKIKVSLVIWSTSSLAGFQSTPTARMSPSFPSGRRSSHLMRDEPMAQVRGEPAAAAAARRACDDSPKSTVKELWSRGRSPMRTVAALLRGVMAPVPSTRKTTDSRSSKNLSMMSTKAPAPLRTRCDRRSRPRPS